MGGNYDNANICTGDAVSSVIPFNQAFAGFPNLIRIAATGLQNLNIAGVPITNGVILTDISITLLNASSTAAGTATIGAAFGYCDQALTPSFFMPIQSLNYSGLATAANQNIVAGNISPIQRDFGSGLIIPAGMVLATQCLTFGNMSNFQFTMDITGFYY